MRILYILAVTALYFSDSALAAETVTKATMYKNPFCGCCEGHAEYLQKSGFDVTMVEVENLHAFKQEKGVPESLEGCHTIMIGGYIVEGHVPVAPIKRLLAEHPQIKGISLPGMPEGSPGMGGAKTAPFKILEIGGSQPPKVFTVE